MPKYKYIGKKDYIIGLNGQRFVKGKIFEESNPKNPYEVNRDFEKIKEVKKEVIIKPKILGGK